MGVNDYIYNYIAIEILISASSLIKINISNNVSFRRRRQFASTFLYILKKFEKRHLETHITTLFLNNNVGNFSYQNALCTK